MKCKTGKKSYRTKLDADITMSRIVERAAKNHKGRYKDLPVRSYHCPLCGKHHLTHQAKGEQE